MPRLKATRETGSVSCGLPGLLALHATIAAAAPATRAARFAVVTPEVKTLAGQRTGDRGDQRTHLQRARPYAGFGHRDQGDRRHHRADLGNRAAWRREPADCASYPIGGDRIDDAATTIGDVARGSRETGDASNRLLASAQSIEGARLKTEVGKFLLSVRAAQHRFALWRHRGFR
jgi:hypothetical protein